MLNLYLISSLCVTHASIVVTHNFLFFFFSFFFFQAEDGIRDLVRSRGLGDVYKRQPETCPVNREYLTANTWANTHHQSIKSDSFKRCSLSFLTRLPSTCLLYTSDAVDERSSVDLGGRRIIKKKKHNIYCLHRGHKINYTPRYHTKHTVQFI